MVRVSVCEAVQLTAWRQTMPADYKGQRVISPEDLGALPIASEINHVVGTNAKKLSRPSPNARVLVLMADKGSWRLRLGDHVASGMPSAVDPTTEVTDGSGAYKVAEGTKHVLAAAGEVTVQGYAATDVLTYYWL